MTQTAPLPDAVQWSEGMMLSPQHLQQNDRYWHAHLRHRLQAVAPHFWGVLKLRFEMVKEILSIGELECILPDGLLVAFPGGLPRNPPGNVEIDVGAACKSGQAPVKVWCWVNPRGSHAAVQDSQERRYNSVLDEPSVDENTGDSALTLPRLQVRFHLYLGVTSPAPHSAVPLLEFVRGENQQLQITPYHPPMLHVGTADCLGAANLWRGLHDFHDRLWDKLAQLGEPGKGGDADDGAGNERRQHLSAARAIGACLPPFSTLLDGRTHPEALYQALARIVGSVSAIGVNPLPLLMKPYQHDDCLPQFQQAMDFVQSRIDTVDTRYETLPFLRTDQHDPGLVDACFERRVPGGMGHELIIEVEPREGQTAAQVLAWLDEAVIADASVMPLLRRARVAGASVRALQPHEIEREKLRSQACLFAVKNQPLELDDQGARHAFGDGALLQVVGRKNDALPASITLYRQKQKHGARGATASVAPAQPAQPPVQPNQPPQPVVELAVEPAVPAASLTPVAPMTPFTPAAVVSTIAVTPVVPVVPVVPVAPTAPGASSGQYAPPTRPAPPTTPGDGNA
ncbi:type VI secretion system baseplate subunit TssK [Burkholderia plantarii]|uniref:Type VI secretion system protein, VC_A0114 family n=1 Tax=Burkholderia plantarii TaxID=41899 RepID=A0A0B6S328_BURPL|nr:type VI secretion system baseplate subunit TssK [Burkholderia plantarii]AJK50073.1 type VI secretion system protein, VC_A0114 family [Burkholderia plantarii]